ncbi:hypothetical protein [Pedobacter antarcticus]|uniref:hypothetical protein n=1 Tax=Pedobacter antarcticus TaxID=34086 RepID=UPI00292E2D99|nr:hypothetical protein [Pedobacter antarcticus]
MQAPKSLPKPQNWQDFESLCKKLWGEIWKCEEIKKNGRSGQAQHGVDVYGNPRGEKFYYGIQCKGKDEYTNKHLTEEEVLTEIEKAKEFVPKLKKLYFATTANKDAVIEAFFRQKNLEHIEADLFEVHLYSWEDIVDLIDENRETYAYYVESQNFKSSKEVDVTFENGEHEITLKPKFRQHVKTYVKDYTAELRNSLVGMSHLWESNPAFTKLYQSAVAARIRMATINLSYVSFCIRIHNTGSEPLEDYKLTFKIQDEIQDISKTNVKDELTILSHMFTPTTYVDNGDMSGELIPRKSILVGDDEFQSNEIFIKPFATKAELNISWKLLSKHYKNSGTLRINIEPEIKRTIQQITVEDAEQQREEPGEINDFLEDKK